MYFLTILFSLVHLLMATRIPFNYCCDDDSSSCEIQQVKKSRKCCYKYERSNCSLKEVEDIFRTLLISVKNISNDSINDLINEISEKLNNNNICHSIQSDIDELIVEVKKCLKEYHNHDIKEIGDIATSYNTKIVKDTEKISLTHTTNINNHINMKLLLTDAELVTYVRDIQNGLLSFINNELSMHSSDITDTINDRIDKMSVVQQKAVGELNSKRIYCVIDAIRNSGKKIKKTIMDKISEMITTIKGGVVSKIIKILDTKLEIQFLRDTILMISKIKMYVECITGRRYDGDISINPIILTEGIQNNTTLIR